MLYRRIIFALLAVLAVVAISACGSSHKASPQAKAEAKQEAALFEQQASKCLPQKNGAPDLFVLRSKTGRHAFAACLVPPSQRVAFERCASRAVIGHFNKVQIESGLNACLRKVS